MRTQKKARPFSRGATFVESGIIISLLVVVTLTLFDFAGLFYTYLAFQHGVAQATRFAVTGNTMNDPHTGAPLSRDASIRQAMRLATPGFTINDSDVTFFDVTTSTAGSGGPNDIIQISVVHKWPLVTPLLQPAFNNGTAIISVSTTMKNEPPA